MPTVAADPLRAFVAECYLAMGVPQDHADLLADTLVMADLWGHPSHGVMRTFWYAARLRSGAMDGAARPETVGGRGALRVIDGREGIGQVMAHAAMRAAIDAAKAHGVGAVSVRNSGHFGTAMYFTRMAAAEGCLGFLSTNASPSMAPWGATESRVGNNPWSWAAPAGRHAPMMLDIANTAVARGKLYVARQKGQPIPEGWAMDAEGRPTTDPSAGIAGTILPMAGHKGYAVSVLMDVASGVLSGSGFLTGITGPYVPEGRSGVGHLAIAIDISAVRPLAEFEADMERMIADLKSAPRAPGVEEVFYPGEPEARAEAKHRAKGIDLPRATADDLRREAAQLGINAPF